MATKKTPILFVRSSRALFLGMAMAIAVAAYVPAKGAAGPDYGSLVHDLTKVDKTPSRMTIVIWMPKEFWKLAFASSGGLSEKGISDAMSVLQPYTLVAVLDAQPGPFGGLNYTDDATLMTSVRLEDSGGALYQPVAQDSVSSGMRNLLGAMRPIMANMMGAMGQHMMFMVFPGTNKAGQPVADGSSNGSLTVHVGDAALRYRLPLESLLPPSLDSKTGESFPGTYRFNPYTGDKLTPGHWSADAKSSSGQ